MPIYATAYAGATGVSASRTKAPTLATSLLTVFVLVCLIPIYQRGLADVKEPAASNQNIPRSTSIHYSSQTDILQSLPLAPLSDATSDFMGSIRYIPRLLKCSNPENRKTQTNQRPRKSDYQRIRLSDRSGSPMLWCSDFLALRVFRVFWLSKLQSLLNNVQFLLSTLKCLRYLALQIPLSFNLSFFVFPLPFSQSQLDLH